MIRIMFSNWNKTFVSILLIGSALLVGTPAKAQDTNGPAYRHHLSVSYGTLTSQDFGALLANVIVPAVSVGTIDPENISLPGAINIAYGYNLSNRFSLGALAGVNFNSYELTMALTNELERYHNRYIYVMPQATFRWLKRADFALYSSVAVGVDFQKESGENSVNFAWQVCSFGLEYYIAHGPVGFFFELGGGNAGLCQLGLRTRF